MRPPAVVVNILTNLCRIIPTWKIIPTQDVIDVAFRDPQVRQEVVIFFFPTFLAWATHTISKIDIVRGFYLIFKLPELMKLNNFKFSHEDRFDQILFATKVGHAF